MESILPLPSASRAIGVRTTVERREELEPRADRRDLPASDPRILAREGREREAIEPIEDRREGEGSEGPLEDAEEERRAVDTVEIDSCVYAIAMSAYPYSHVARVCSRCCSRSSTGEMRK